MEFKPFEKKLVAVINEKTEVGRAINALAHMAVGLRGSVYSKEELRLQDYHDADGGKHPQISDLPFISLRGGSDQTHSSPHLTPFFCYTFDRKWLCRN